MLEIMWNNQHLQNLDIDYQYDYNSTNIIPILKPYKLTFLYHLMFEIQRYSFLHPSRRHKTPATILIAFMNPLQ